MATTIRRVPRGRALQQGGEAPGVGIGEGALDRELREPVGLRRDLGDQSIIIEDERGGERVAGTSVGPAVHSDERRLGVECDDPAGRQPLDRWMGLTERDHRIPDGPDATVIVVVIAEDVPERRAGRGSQVEEVGDQSGGRGEVPGQDDGTDGPRRNAAWRDSIAPSSAWSRWRSEAQRIGIIGLLSRTGVARQVWCEPPDRID